LGWLRSSRRLWLSWGRLAASCSLIRLRHHLRDHFGIDVADVHLLAVRGLLLHDLLEDGGDVTLRGHVLRLWLGWWLWCWLWRRWRFCAGQYLGWLLLLLFLWRWLILVLNDLIDDGVSPTGQGQLLLGLLFGLRLLLGWRSWHRLRLWLLWRFHGFLNLRFLSFLLFVL